MDECAFARSGDGLYVGTCTCIHAPTSHLKIGAFSDRLCNGVGHFDISHGTHKLDGQQQTTNAFLSILQPYQTERKEKRVSNVTTHITKFHAS